MGVMTEKKHGVSMFLLCWVFLLSLAAPAQAFSVPERLEYSIRWEFVHAGNSSLEITEEEDGRARIVSTARSSDFLSVFYKVDDRIEVTAESATLLPFVYHLNLREGRHRKNRVVTYKRDEEKIVLNNIHDNDLREFDDEGAVYDPITAFYRLRQMEMEVGKSLFIRVFDNGKLYDVEVQVLKKEKVTVPAGTFDAIMVKPLLKSEGIFMRKGDVYIWLTDDERKIPVKMKSRVKVGAINAVLTGGAY